MKFSVSQIFFLSLFSPIWFCFICSPSEVYAGGETSSIEQDSKTIDLVIEIDPSKASPDHLQNLESLQTQAAENPQTISKISESKLKKLIHIVNDLGAMSGASLYIVAVATNQPQIGHIGSGIFSAGLLLDYLLHIERRAILLTEQFLNFNSVCQICDSIGHAAAVTGLCMLSTDGTSHEMASWITTGGFLLKAATLTAQLIKYGPDKTFGNNRKASNIISKFVLLTVGGTVGGVLLATSASTNREELNVIGGYVLGSSILLGSSEALWRNLKAL